VLKNVTVFWFCWTKEEPETFTISRIGEEGLLTTRFKQVRSRYTMADLILMIGRA